jgi:hypothetical protein
LRTVKRQSHYFCMRLGHLIGDHIPVNVERGPDVAVSWLSVKWRRGVLR